MAGFAAMLNGSGARHMPALDRTRMPEALRTGAAALSGLSLAPAPGAVAQREVIEQDGRFRSTIDYNATSPRTFPTRKAAEEYEGTFPKLTSADLEHETVFNEDTASVSINSTVKAESDAPFSNARDLKRGGKPFTAFFNELSQDGVFTFKGNYNYLKAGAVEGGNGETRDGSKRPAFDHSDIKAGAVAADQLALAKAEFARNGREPPEALTEVVRHDVQNKLTIDTMSRFVDAEGAVTDQAQAIAAFYGTPNGGSTRGFLNTINHDDNGTIRIVPNAGAAGMDIRLGVRPRLAAGAGPSGAAPDSLDQLLREAGGTEQGRAVRTRAVPAAAGRTATSSGNDPLSAALAARRPARLTRAPLAGTAPAPAGRRGGGRL
jgi:hypothetical protein